ncbi:E3 ubiquitin-protein ligase TRAIP-like [Anopheles maculipalpis]|uniref:E3 ubiquitin-protein ligase TRAIP-like n=1 Tax=Anopheles maculipalpis TaxID=1496333 RepID=UPI0021593150|nr:E3 ubiquitin-protein ligase TRAIP-like [Anopheles maculipalpis]
MNLVCPICSDIFVPSAEVNITPCGHMFHHLCLLQWLERSKTCPQCRERCIATRLIKVYFNVTANLDTTEDSASLLEKLDNLTLKIREQEKLLKGCEANAAQHKTEQKKMRKTLLGLEEEIRSKNTAMFAMKHELDMMRGHLKTLVKVQKELEDAQTKLQLYMVIKQALDDTAQEVEQMLTNNMSREAAITLAVALKRELQAQEMKRKTQSERITHLQNNEIDQRRKIKALEEKLSASDSEIYQLEQQLKQQAKELCINTSTESVGSPGEIVPNTPDQRPKIGRKRPVPDLNNSTPLSEKVRKIIDSNSPYLRVKTSSIGLAPLMRGGLSANPAPSTSSASAVEKPKLNGGLNNKYSIFSKKRIAEPTSGLAPVVKSSSAVQDENKHESKAEEESTSLAGPRFTLTSSTVTARLKAGKLTRHPSSVMSPEKGANLLSLDDLDSIFE